MLEPHWAEKKNTKKNQNSDTLHPQTLQSFCMPHYTEKTEGLPPDTGTKPAWETETKG
jgi:hypothetical protein